MDVRYRFNLDAQGGFPMPCKEGHLLVDKKADIEYPFEHGEVINYTLDGVSIHPVTTKIQVSFITVAREEGNLQWGL